VQFLCRRSAIYKSSVGSLMKAKRMTLTDHSFGQLTAILYSWLHSPDEKREKLPLWLCPHSFVYYGGLGLFLSLK